MSTTQIHGEQLRQIVESIENLEKEKAAIADLVKEVYSLAKGHGFDVGIVREVVRIRKADPSERNERDALLDLYLSAVGAPSTPSATRSNVTALHSGAAA